LLADGAFVLGLEAFEDVAGCRGLHAARGEQVLHADRHTGELAQRLARRAVGIDLVGSFQRIFRRCDDEGVERAGGGDIGVERFGHFARGEFTRGNAVTDRLDAQFGNDAHYSITFGTPKKPCSGAGALASTSSRTPPPVSGSASITSSRRRSFCGITAVIGSMPVQSTSPSCSTQARIELNSGTIRSSACSSMLMRARPAIFATVSRVTDMARALAGHGAAFKRPAIYSNGSPTGFPSR